MKPQKITGRELLQISEGALDDLDRMRKEMHMAIMEPEAWEEKQKKEDQERLNRFVNSPKIRPKYKAGTKIASLSTWPSEVDLIITKVDNKRQLYFVKRADNMKEVSPLYFGEQDWYRKVY